MTEEDKIREQIRIMTRNASFESSCEFYSRDNLTKSRIILVISLSFTLLLYVMMNK